MSENSSFSNFVTLQKNIFKRRKWLIVLAFVTFILFDAGFLSLYLTGLTRSSAIDAAKEMLGAGNINTVIVLVGSVLLAIEGFHWLSNKQKIDFYESQPISRNAHFVGVIINSAVTLKSVCKEFSDLDLKYIERNCIGDVSISNKAVHQDHPDRTIELGGDERATASV